MSSKLQGRVRYNSDKDSYDYEVRGADGEWGLCIRCRCVRREGAAEDEGTNYVGISLIQNVLHDVCDLGVELVR